MRSKVIQVCRAIFLLGSLLATASAASAAHYQFKVVEAARPSQSPSIELINTTTGEVMPGIEIYVVHTQYIEHRKGQLNFRRIFVPLQDHLSGNCAHSERETPSNGELTLEARVPGRFWSVWGTVDLGD